MTDTNVVCFKWQALHRFRTNYRAEHVNMLRRMVARHYQKPHQFYCVTDDPRGLEEGVTPIPIENYFPEWKKYVALPPPQGGMNPSCYVRLKAFDTDIFGPRFVCIDLDCVILSDLSPLWDRPNDFIIWKSGLQRNHYNGSMFIQNAFARKQVWDQFEPRRSPKEAARVGLVGSDQAWIEHCLGPSEKTWSPAGDGVYSYRLHLARLGGKILPQTRLVFFQGTKKPWMPDVRKLSPWVERHYR